MAYTQATYTDSPLYPLYTEVTADRVMDSEFERSVSPLNAADPWAVHRYLMDQHKPSVVPCRMMDSVMPALISPFTPAQFRSTSPSYTNPSSTCSSALSPPRDNDYCQSRSPPTSSDVPYLSQYESWSQVYEFTGLADGCVSLGDVNPIQDYNSSYYDDSMQHFDITPRSSMSSDCSNVNSDVWNDNEILSTPRDVSAETPAVKEEMDDPEPMDSPQSRPEGVDYTICVQGPSVKVEQVDDDGDDHVKYNPFNKLRFDAPKPNGNKKSIKRRRDPSSSPELKRPKVSDTPSLVLSGTKASIQGAKGQYTCPECPRVAFKDQTSLESHIKKQHTRPFTCIFDFAGCSSTFASKNEWKRHCTSQHIGLQYWVCQQDSCAQHSNNPNASTKAAKAAHKRPSPLCSSLEEASTLPNGSIFNRKDLYTQHLRRMHVPAHLKKQVKSKKHVPEWDEQQRVHQAEAVRIRCRLPTHMTCPATDCTMQFEGANAWDERMEHVAKHLEKAAAGLEPAVHFGGDNDGTLVNWANSPAIGILKKGDGGRWMLQNPLKNSDSPAGLVVQEQEQDDEDADAEGEEVDY